jgi:hypothetical protein
VTTNLTGTQVRNTYSQLLHVSGGPEATEKVVHSGTGVATALKVGTGSVSVDNIKLDGNTISATNTNGDITIAPNGTGAVIIPTATFTTLLAAAFSTVNAAAHIDITGTSVTADGTNANINITLTPKGTGSVSIPRVSITGGSASGMTSVAATTVEGTTVSTVGAAAHLDVSGTTLTADGTNTNIDITLTPKGTGKVFVDGVSIDGGVIATTATNADIVLSPNGTGEIVATRPFGYGGSGTGGTVTQLTSRTTGVTLNRLSGQITLFAATTIAGHGSNEFTLTNSFIDPTDVVYVCFASGLTGASYDATVTAVGTGSCKIAVSNHNNSATPADTPVLNFVVFKGVNA